MSAGQRYSLKNGTFRYDSNQGSVRYEYLWEDGVKYKRPTKLSAPEYVDALMNWAQGLLDNEKYFPNQIGASVDVAPRRPSHPLWTCP